MLEDSEGEAGITEIDASEILDKIQKGEPVEYDYVKIIGDLDISKLDLHTEHADRFQNNVLKFPDESKVVCSSLHIDQTLPR